MSDTEELPENPFGKNKEHHGTKKTESGEVFPGEEGLDGGKIAFPKEAADLSGIGPSMPIIVFDQFIFAHMFRNT